MSLSPTLLTPVAITGYLASDTNGIFFWDADVQVQASLLHSTSVYFGAYNDLVASSYQVDAEVLKRSGELLKALMDGAGNRRGDLQASATMVGLVMAWGRLPAKLKEHPSVLSIEDKTVFRDLIDAVRLARRTTPPPKDNSDVTPLRRLGEGSLFAGVQAVFDKAKNGD